MQTLISCYGNRTIYPGFYRSMAPMRCDLVDRGRMAVIISMCGIKKPQNRLAILENLEKTVKSRNDVFITLLSDGLPFKSERDYVDRLGLEYSNKCVVLSSFSDYEYMNILTNNDVFIDLNPLNDVGYLLSTALQRGLLVGGYNQPLYRDILADGEYGMLFKGNKKEYGYGFDYVVPNWDSMFRVLNEKLFSRDKIVRLMGYRNDRPNLQRVFETRQRLFLGMFMYLADAKIGCGSFSQI